MPIQLCVYQIVIVPLPANTVIIVPDNICLNETQRELDNIISLLNINHLPNFVLCFQINCQTQQQYSLARKILVCFSSPVTGLKIQHMILPCDRFVRRVIFMWKNLASSCEYDFDDGGSVFPLLSLHSIWGCGNHPPELHSTMTPSASGA